MTEKIPDGAYFVNRDDWDNHFWKHRYIVYVTEQGIPFCVNAEYEQCAIDEIIDFCENNLPGLINTYQELQDSGYSDMEIEDFFTYGGNHGIYLNTSALRFIEVS